jgi:hypothetical protein
MGKNWLRNTFLGASPNTVSWGRLHFLLLLLNQGVRYGSSPGLLTLWFCKSLVLSNFGQRVDASVS